MKDLIYIALVVALVFSGSALIFYGQKKSATTYEPVEQTIQLPQELGRFQYAEGFTVATSGQMTIFNNVQVLATSSTKRLYAIICNDSSNVVYLSIDEDAPAAGSEGIRLNANGGCWEMLATENPYDGAIRATSSASSVLTVTAADF